MIVQGQPSRYWLDDPDFRRAWERAGTDAQLELFVDCVRDPGAAGARVLRFQGEWLHIAPPPDTGHRGILVTDAPLHPEPHNPRTCLLCRGVSPESYT